MSTSALFALLLPILAISCATGADGYHSRGFQVDGMSCEHGEPLRQHEHVHLSVVAEGKTVPVPDYVGLDNECLLPVHTYDGSGVIHIETASERQFTLGSFFSVWAQPLTSGTLMNLKVDATHEIRAFVDGQRFDADPATIPLTPHADIVVIYGPPFTLPPPYRFSTAEP